MVEQEEISIKALQAQGSMLIALLRDHIYKENHILYPMAHQVIQDPALWDKMKEACDTIGYCCFSPQ